MMHNVNRRGGRDRGRGHYKGHVEHDDRVPLPQDGTRRVQVFKNRSGRNNKHNRQRGWDNKIRVLLNDEDVDMSSNARPNDRANNYHKNHRREGGAGGDWRKNRVLPESPSTWYKIIVRSGNKYAKDYLLKTIGNYLQPTPFIPMGFKMSKDEVTFAVDDHKTATDLMNADKKITTNDGWKLCIKVRPFTPMIEVDPKLSAAMKAVMATRYNPAVKALNLKKFHADPAFVSEDLFCPLNRPNLMMAALDIISESIPDLIALDISDNKLNQIEHMKIMIEKTPHLKILHMGNNKLRDIRQLDVLKGLQLEEIDLDGNTLCGKFDSQEVYIREVRQRFPKVIRLDGANLPPPILFDVEDEGTLPISQPSFMAAPEGTEMAKQFLQQYYQLYDADGTREPLHQAYHDAAQFSYDIFVPANEQGFASISSYINDSRNLLRATNLDKRVKNLKIGKSSIIATLNNLPKTKHDPSSFVVDLVVFTPQLIQLNVCGLFSETSPKNKTLLRAFSRVFIIIPVGGGFCIVNDQLTISHPTPEQIRKANKQKAEAAAAAAAASQVPNPVEALPSAAGISSPVAAPVAPLAPPNPADLLDISTKQQMVTTLSMSSGMNLLWSEKCLNETNWNYEQAMFAFTKLHKDGAIPAEAFVK